MQSQGHGVFSPVTNCSSHYSVNGVSAPSRSGLIVTQCNEARVRARVYGRRYTGSLVPCPAARPPAPPTPRLFISIFHGHLVFPEVLTWKLQVQIFRTCANQQAAYTAFLSADKFATPQRSSYTCKTMEELASPLCPAKIACSAT